MNKEQKKKILVIEDEISLAHNLLKALSAEGYDVDHAANGQIGLEMIRSSYPDLVLLDIKMPQLDGLAILGMIRRSNDESLSQIPIIMLTALAMEGDEAQALYAGANDYIIKPYRLAPLLARIRTRMADRFGLESRNNNSIGSDEINSKNLRVIESQHRVFKNNMEIVLSPKEFALLLFFMQNRKVVLSRDLLLRRIWGEDFFGDKRTLDVHVRWLREKIEDDPAQPLWIETVRGIGYRFNE